MSPSPARRRDAIDAALHHIQLTRPYRRSAKDGAEASVRKLKLNEVTDQVRRAKASAREALDAGAACEKAAAVASAAPRGGGGDLAQLAKRCAEKREAASKAHVEARAFRDEALKHAEAQRAADEAERRRREEEERKEREAEERKRREAEERTRREEEARVAAEAEALRRKDEAAKREHEAKIAKAKDAAAAEALRKAEIVREAWVREAERAVRVRAEKLKRAKEKAEKDAQAAKAFAAFDVPTTRLSDVQPPTPQKLTTRLSGGFAATPPAAPPPEDDDEDLGFDDEAGYDQDDDDFVEEAALSPTRRVSAEWVVQHLRKFKRWYVVERLGSDGNVCKYEAPPPPPPEILNRPHPPLPPRRELYALRDMAFRGVDSCPEDPAPRDRRPCLLHCVIARKKATLGSAQFSLSCLRDETLLTAKLVGKHWHLFDGDATSPYGRVRTRGVPPSIFASGAPSTSSLRHHVEGAAVASSPRDETSAPPCAIVDREYAVAATRPRPVARRADPRGNQHVGAAGRGDGPVRAPAGEPGRRAAGDSRRRGTARDRLVVPGVVGRRQEPAGRPPLRSLLEARPAVGGVHAAGPGQEERQVLARLHGSGQGRVRQELPAQRGGGSRTENGQGRPRAPVRQGLGQPLPPRLRRAVHADDGLRAGGVDVRDVIAKHRTVQDGSAGYST